MAEVSVEESQEPDVVSVVEEEVPEAEVAPGDGEEAPVIEAPVQEVVMEPVGDVGSVHEKIQDQHSPDAVLDKLQAQPLESLNKGIDLNDSFVYVSELFSGNKEAYTKAIAHLDDMATKDEALGYANATLAPEYGWNLEIEPARKFINLIERRYN